jgi:hypothetical protein
MEESEPASVSRHRAKENLKKVAGSLVKLTFSVAGEQSLVNERQTA